MAVFIKLKQYKNKTKSSYGKWYADTVHTGEVHTDDIARKISENTTFRPGEVKGIIDELVDEMKLQLQESKVVVIDGLGRFRLTVESDGVDKKKDFDLQRNVKSVVCKFLPSGHRLSLNGGDKRLNPKQHDLSAGADVKWWVDGE